MLAASNAVLRTWKPRDVREPVDVFVDLVEKLADLDAGGRLGAILDELRPTRSVAYAAGVARRLAADTLHGHGDTELVGLLRAYVDPASLWSDERSWSRLGPVR